MCTSTLIPITQVLHVAVYRMDWLGIGREEWEGRLCEAPGSSSVPSLLRRQGLPARLTEALCAELGLMDR